MIEQLQKFPGNTIAFEVINSFTETDEKVAQKLLQEKLAQGFDYLNILIKLDEMKISKSSTKAFMEDIIWTFRNYQQMGNIAIVAHSNILKALVPIDNFFFERLRKGFQERYFDVSHMEEAIEFVKEGK